VLNNGAYVDPELRCESGGVSGEDAGKPMGSDPIEAARALLTGLEPNDDLMRVGYTAVGNEASVGVMRDGALVAILTLERVAGGWAWAGFSSCSGSGVSY